MEDPEMILDPPSCYVNRIKMRKNRYSISFGAAICLLMGTVATTGCAAGGMNVVDLHCESLSDFDLDDDCTTNLVELSEMASHWLFLEQ
jgi:hypothetical protein